METHDIQGELDFLAAIILLGLDFETTVERAAICEIDAGMSRRAANVEAVFLYLKSRGRTVSRKLVGEFIAAAGAALEAEHDEGWSRSETIAFVLARLHQGQRDVAPMISSERVAV